MARQYSPKLLKILRIKSKVPCLLKISRIMTCLDKNEKTVTVKKDSLNKQLRLLWVRLYSCMLVVVIGYKRRVHLQLN